MEYIGELLDEQSADAADVERYFFDIVAYCADEEEETGKRLDSALTMLVTFFLLIEGTLRFNVYRMGLTLAAV